VGGNEVETIGKADYLARAVAWSRIFIIGTAQNQDTAGGSDGRRLTGISTVKRLGDISMATGVAGKWALRHPRRRWREGVETREIDCGMKLVFEQWVQRVTSQKRTQLELAVSWMLMR
jgi:hypothetical protein